MGGRVKWNCEVGDIWCGWLCCWLNFAWALVAMAVKGDDCDENGNKWLNGRLNDVDAGGFIFEGGCCWSKLPWWLDCDNDGDVNDWRD